MFGIFLTVIFAYLSSQASWKGLAADEEALVGLHFLVDAVQILDGDEIGRGKDVILFRGLSLFPVKGLIGIVDKPFVLRHGGGKHGGVVFLADDPVTPPVLFKKRRSEAEIAESAAAFPVHCFADTALIRPRQSPSSCVG